MPQIKPSDQLCWYCAKAAGNLGGCSWSRDLIPVKGWTAEPVTKSEHCHNNAMETFSITECPEFVRDTYFPCQNGTTLPEVPKPKYLISGCKALMEELVFQVGKDLLETTEDSTEYHLATCLYNLGAESIADKILKKKGKTYSDLQRNRALAE